MTSVCKKHASSYEWRHIQPIVDIHVVVIIAYPLPHELQHWYQRFSEYIAIHID